MADSQKVYLGETLLNKHYVGEDGVRSFLGGSRYSDPDVVAFLNASGITDETIGDAIDTLVATMKSDGLWSKMIAVYPFVGGTASTHKWNLVDPQDTDAAHRVTWGTNVTHSSTGVKINGSAGGGPGRPYIIPGTDTSFSSLSVGFYSRTADAANKYDTGADGSGSNRGFLFTANEGSNQIAIKNGGTGLTYIANGDGRGFYQTTRDDVSSSFETSKNSTISNTTNFGVGTYGGEFYIGAAGQSVGTPVAVSNREFAFFYWGTELSNTELLDYYSAVQTFQTSLSREV
jgi:hypothetical protein